MDRLVDFNARREVREAKKRETEAYFQRKGDGIMQRQRILSKAIKEMAEFSTPAEMAKTLRFCIDVLEGRED